MGRALPRAAEQVRRAGELIASLPIGIAPDHRGADLSGAQDTAIESEARPAEPMAAEPAVPMSESRWRLLQALPPSALQTLPPSAEEPTAEAADEEAAGEALAVGPTVAGAAGEEGASSAAAPSSLTCAPTGAAASAPTGAPSGELSVEDAYQLVKQGKCKELLERLGTPCTGFLLKLRIPAEDTAIAKSHARFAKPGIELGPNEDFWLEAARYASPLSGWTFAHQLLYMAPIGDEESTEYATSLGLSTRSALRVFTYLLTAHGKLGRSHEDVMNLVTSAGLKVKDVECASVGFKDAVTKWYRGWPRIQGLEYCNSDSDSD